MPTVSVIMPCYNHGKYVGEAISSVLNQTYTDFEFLIVENGSADNSWDVISGFHDERMRVWRFEKNDMDGAMELMVKATRGKYVAQMFSDDYWEPEKLMKQVNALENNPDYMASATWSVLCDENLNVIEGEKDTFIQKNRSRTEWIKQLLDRGNCLPAPSLIARRDLYLRFYKATGGTYQIPDWYQWLVMLKETNIYMIEEVLTKNRVHRDSANISLVESEATQIRVITEYTILISQIIEEMSDEDFVEVFRDMMVNPSATGHLEIICEKLLVLMKKCAKNGNFAESVLRYFYKYYSYEENGVYVSDVLRQKYNYSRVDFKNLSDHMGYIYEAYQRQKSAPQQN